ncbi:putative nuclease HARBI1 [Hyposmocoma kahamanoa]|uniref:putative nuclease HARBI1 n=1 Tax=Hyposmocoma kahamanoa TaxID=1477025 RepID=UPI000E6D6DC2|nr:putative nuclease HARBI1 [Hyposmocoma kahamanoa]
MPGVIGCIVSTHIAIVRPNDHEESFCRKNYHSLNVQLICNADMQIISTDARHGRGTHDSLIWSHHPLCAYLNNLSSNEGLWLLDDSGYPLRRTVTTPILDALEGSEEEKRERLVF